MNSMSSCCQNVLHPRVVSKKVRIPVSEFQSSDASSQILLVNIPERNNIELPSSAVPSKK